VGGKNLSISPKTTTLRSFQPTVVKRKQKQEEDMDSIHSDSSSKEHVA
jgi:hypothetical protein